jgi:hypothetical protein
VSGAMAVVVGEWVLDEWLPSIDELDDGDIS